MIAGKPIDRAASAAQCLSQSPKCPLSPPTTTGVSPDPQGRHSRARALGWSGCQFLRLFSENSESVRTLLVRCLRSNERRIRIASAPAGLGTSTWGVGPGQLYGYRVHGLRSRERIALQPQQIAARSYAKAMAAI